MTMKVQGFAFSVKPTEYVTSNFQICELVHSEIAVRNGIDNTPGYVELQELCSLARNVLQPTRDVLGPFTPNSAFRCQEVERLLKGKPHNWTSKSQHPKGQAVDYRVPGVGLIELAEWTISEIENFDQLIVEFWDAETDAGWLHVSQKMAGYNRKQVLHAFRMGNRTMYAEGLPV